MKIITFIFLSSLYSYPILSQKKNATIPLQVWKKAVVNIEAETLLYPKFYIDSIVNTAILFGFSERQSDSLRTSLSRTKITTGTGIYIIHNGRKYIITAKHVLFDENMAIQKDFENKRGINNWENVEAIQPRISIRTPYQYWFDTRSLNNYGILTNNFVPGNRPFFFISDSTGDGIAVLSLQEKNFKVLDTLLMKNGYTPIPAEKILADSLNALDEVYTIGYPERISIVGVANTPFTMVQTSELVVPFIVSGKVAMYQNNIQHYFVDLTVFPGNSGGPVIKGDKLVGIISGINKYQIINESEQGKGALFGIGHLVNVINLTQLIPQLDAYWERVERLIPR